MLCLNCQRLATEEEAAAGPCPQDGCGARTWAYVCEPTTAYTLTRNDRRFLRSLRIVADDDGSAQR